MKAKLRRICVNGIDFFWRVLERPVSWDKDPENREYVLLRIWVAGRKAHPWINVLYQFDNRLSNYGVVLAATEKPEYMERAMAYFEFKPLLPKAVANTTQLAMELLGERSLDEFKSRGVELYLDKNEKLHLASS